MADAPPRLVAVRHAPTRAEGRCVGRSDVPVRLPPHHVAARLRAIVEDLGLRPAEVWSSRALRCAAPAKRVARELGLPHVLAEEVAELDHGRFEGRTWASIEEDDAEALAHWMEAWQERAPPGGETVAELSERVARFWHRLPGDATALLVAHAGVVRALRVLRGGLSWDEAMRLPVVHLEPEIFR